MTHDRSTAMRYAPRRRARRGFTMISMLVALVLLSVGVLALAQANAASIKVGTRSANRGVALGIARAYLEEVRTRDPWAVTNETAIRVGADGVPNSTGAYTRTLTATVERVNLLRVSISVDYPNPTGPIAVDTYLYRPNGLNANP
ncbi:MAG: prepilin-type N-terminal cleavage/methylation domain-containing protein [Gemmatimonadaceae bacterium]|jgi:type IV pilus assembly protein PilV|nr:prepilin-type N-terminal cleavage/methylation domain-containing protein [Gemmatimonadaceae bacterium]